MSYINIKMYTDRSMIVFCTAGFITGVIGLYDAETFLLQIVNVLGFWTFGMAALYYMRKI